MPLVRGRIDTIIDRLNTLHHFSQYPELAAAHRELTGVRGRLLSVAAPPLPAELARDLETALTRLDQVLPTVHEKVQRDRRFHPYHEFRRDWDVFSREMHEYIIFITRGRMNELRPRATTMPHRTAPPAPTSTMPTLEQPFRPARAQSHPPLNSGRPPRPATAAGSAHPRAPSRGPMPVPSAYPPASAQSYHHRTAPPPAHRPSLSPIRHTVPPVIPPPEYYPARPPPAVPYGRAPPPAHMYPRSRTPYPAAAIPVHLAHVYAQSPAMAVERL
ncbi:hypothetical protein AURDEDRAFT_112565 [Auricularia subglabra TFB-10046 SS5]|nr:hypothetical protein AURDEDRAFT_112565 [Auricularia subglabra TFB-10046 SS5]